MKIKGEIRIELSNGKILIIEEGNDNNITISTTNMENIAIFPIDPITVAISVDEKK